MSDIVLKLRERAGPDTGVGLLAGPLLADAADEIERLQSRLEAAEKFPNDWHCPGDLLRINELERRLEAALKDVALLHAEVHDTRKLDRCLSENTNEKAREVRALGD